MMLIKVIDEHLQAKPKDERRIRCFHPSSLHKTPKELYYHYLKGDNDQKFDSRTLRIFDNGHDVHRRLQGYLEGIGVLKQAEIPVVNDEYEISGHADGIVQIGGLEGVLEIKSVNTNTFFSSFEPKNEHLIQLNVYMFCLGIPRGCILYECKDNQQLKEFYCKQDANILNPILKKIKHVQDCIRQGKEPENG